MASSYGGIYERGSREYTLDDFYSLQLDKMDRYTCLKESGVIIPDGDDESSSDDDDDDDDEDEDDEDDDDDRDIGGDDADEGQDVHVVEEIEEEPEEQFMEPGQAATTDVAVEPTEEQKVYCEFCFRCLQPLTSLPGNYRKNFVYRLQHSWVSPRIPHGHRRM